MFFSKICIYFIEGGEEILLLDQRLELVDKTELKMAVDKIQSFVEADMAGEVIRLGQSRLLLLPSTFDISEGESFAY